MAPRCGHRLNDEATRNLSNFPTLQNPIKLLRPMRQTFSDRSTTFGSSRNRRPGGWTPTSSPEVSAFRTPARPRHKCGCHECLVCRRTGDGWLAIRGHGGQGIIRGWCAHVSHDTASWRFAPLTTPYGAPLWHDLKRLHAAAQGHSQLGLKQGSLEDPGSRRKPCR